MAGVSKAKTQQSITSFFSVGTKSPPVVKRKAAEQSIPDDDADTKATAKSTKPPRIVKANKPSNARTINELKKRKLVMEDVEDKDKSEDVAMEEPQANEVDEEVPEQASESEVEEEDEVPLTCSPSQKKKKEETRTKLGRRRLRQRIVDEDEEEDDEFSRLSTVKKSVEEVDLSMSDEEDVQVVQILPEAVTIQEKSPIKTSSVQPTRAEREKKEETQDTTEVETKNVADEEEEKDSTKELKEKEVEEVTNDSNEKIEAGEEKPKTQPTQQPSTRPVRVNSKAQEKTTTTVGKPNTDTTITSDNHTISYSTLAYLLNQIENTSGRLLIQDLIMNYFRQVILQAPHDLLPSIYLCVCTDLAPPFENLKIGIGDAILMKAISEATGSAPKFIKEMYQKEGDLGKVAQNARSKQHTLSFTSIQQTVVKPTPLSVKDVYQQFVKIAKMTGNNSQQVKCSMIKQLLVKCEKDKKTIDATNGSPAAEAAKYIIRGLQGKLRIGLAEKTILIGLTYAFMLEKDLKEKEKQEKALGYVKKAFAESPSYNELVKAFEHVQAQVPASQRPFLRVRDFEKVAERCVLSPGTPVSPMLARPTKAYAMVFDRFQGQPFTCEYKYDGERAQIHILPNGEIAIFSRNFENSTERFPDVKLMIKKAIDKEKCTSCIMDAEVVAVDKATNKRLPFQVLSTRSRKNVKVEEIKVPVCIYAFDLLYLNGVSRLKEPLAKRRELLYQHFTVTPGSFEFASSLDVDAVDSTTDAAEALEVAVDKVRCFLEEAVKENCEGLMVKTIQKDATYEPANRSHKWLKLKKDYLDGIGDSTDLVPIGAFYGRGKRTGVYGAYLLACYDPDTEMYQAITKLGTGLSDEKLKEFYEQLKEKVVDRIPSDYVITEGIKPDVWFKSSCVWEILGADLSISPKYTAGMGLVAKDKGISLRFPRFIRVREDKNPTQATTASQIADLYRAQDLVTVSTGVEEDDDEMMI